MTDRYLFHVFPAVITIVFAVLYRLGLALFRRPSHAGYLLIAAAIVYGAFHITTDHNFLYGPSQAAELIVTGSPTRILYSGRADGNFIFAVRSLDPRLNTVVIRGEKLRAATFAADEFERFAHRYGINYIVLEQTEHRQYSWFGKTTAGAWNQLIASPSPSMVLEETLPMRSSRTSFNGTIFVYRFTNPSPAPENVLKTRLNLVGERIDLEF